MKKIFNCFNKVIDKDLFYKAYLNSQKGKCSKKVRAVLFSLNWVVNLEILRKEVETLTYKPLEYSVFKVYEPKERIVQAPHYRDKIVQYCITQVLRDIYEPCFIFDSYACIRNKGNHLCVKRLFEYFRKCKKLYKGGCILKMDIKKFFPSVNHQILKDILRKKIADLKMLKLLDLIIDSNGEGLNIGNSTSQIFSNIYLNELDNFVKRKLKCKYYIRYADDLFLFCYNREIALDYRKNIDEYLVKNLKLKAHKVQINSIDYGVSALGFHFKPTFLRMLKRNVKKVVKYDKEKDYKKRCLQLNNSYSATLFAKNMYLYGVMEGFQWDYKKKKYIFK